MTTALTMAMMTYGIRIAVVEKAGAGYQTRPVPEQRERQFSAQPFDRTLDDQGPAPHRAEGDRDEGGQGLRE
jgi:hypothetical protein